MIEPFERGTRLIYVRWTGLLALFARLEVAALTLRFDTKTLEGGPLWLEGLFGLLRVGFDVVVVGAAVVLLLRQGMGDATQLRRIELRALSFLADRKKN